LLPPAANGQRWVEATMAIKTSPMNHIRMKVTGIDRQRAFLRRNFFALPAAIEMPAVTPPEEQGRHAFLYGGVLYNLGCTSWGCGQLPRILLYLSFFPRPTAKGMGGVFLYLDVKAEQ
jgi:hypothetical protein